MTNPKNIIGKILNNKKDELFLIKNITGSSKPYKELKKKFPKLDPFGDFDNDSIPNFKDCQPFNTMRQDQIIQTANNGRSFKITQPDGRLIHYFKYQPRSFRLYMIEMVSKYGMNPNVRTFEVELGYLNGVPVLTAYW